MVWHCSRLKQNASDALRVWVYLSSLAQSDAAGKCVNFPYTAGISHPTCRLLINKLGGLGVGREEGQAESILDSYSCYGGAYELLKHHDLRSQKALRSSCLYPSPSLLKHQFEPFGVHGRLLQKFLLRVQHSRFGF